MSTFEIKMGAALLISALALGSIMAHSSAP